MNNQPKEIRWIATRILHTNEKPSTQLIIKIGEPEEDSDQKWRCPYVFIVPKKEMKVQWAYSVDALGSLINAIMGIRKAIDESSKQLIWLGKEMEHDIPRFIPNVINSEFTEHLENLVEEEVKKYVDEMEMGKITEQKQGK